MQSWKVQCFGKWKMTGKHTLESRYGKPQSSVKSSPYHRWFEASQSNGQPGCIFGESVAFYSIGIQGQTKLIMVYIPLEKVQTPLPTVVCGKWPSSNKLAAMETVHIQSLVGIWKAGSDYVYILQKHPSLLGLTAAEYGTDLGDFEEE
ncbi:hypothetical protein BDZ94DRAFT_860875 [Collybia nuda]|uniref:Uncharacterized protein n=1 Tax=Collybia nuda TaxID=64659 RepID=A0A9P5Y2C0_9AGAR|nr:hypothetical protein BDZ94DRAFT_860875 [Collybia nuda]